MARNLYGGGSHTTPRTCFLNWREKKMLREEVIARHTANRLNRRESAGRGVTSWQGEKTCSWALLGPGGRTRALTQSQQRQVEEMP